MVLLARKQAGHRHLYPADLHAPFFEKKTADGRSGTRGSGLDVRSKNRCEETCARGTKKKTGAWIGSVSHGHASPREIGKPRTLQENLARVRSLCTPVRGA